MHDRNRRTKLWLNLALLVLIEAALAGAFMWIHGPTQQFVQRTNPDQPRGEK